LHACGTHCFPLNRAFLAAGVLSVVVSLWAVSDECTADLMVYFHENLVEEKMNKAHALRNAILKLKEVAPDPKYWAAFTLVGSFL